MKTRKRSALRTAIERTLLERDRREIASVERVLRALRIESQPKPATPAGQRRGR
jgi:hypothetical protein